MAHGGLDLLELALAVGDPQPLGQLVGVVTVGTGRPLEPIPQGPDQVDGEALGQPGTGGLAPRPATGAVGGGQEGRRGRQQAGGLLLGPR